MAHGKGGTILVIDDEPMVRSAVGRVLADEGYTVAYASDGAAALATLAEQRFDVVLLDLMMPGMNGRQFLHALRRDRGDPVPVVVMTAVHGLGQRAISLGATDVVEKPFDVDELLNKIALAVFRGRQEATGETALPTTAPGRADAPSEDVVVVIDRDLAALAALEARLSEGGFAVVAMPTVPPDATRLLRALDPTAIVVAADDSPDGGTALARTVHAADGLAEVPVILCSRDATLAATATPSAMVLTRPSPDELVRVLELLRHSTADGRDRAPW